MKRVLKDDNVREGVYKSFIYYYDQICILSYNVVKISFFNKKAGEKQNVDGAEEGSVWGY